MSFTAQIQNPTSQNPNDQQRFSSWRESEPSPMGYGCLKTGLKWMTDVFNVQTPPASKYSNYYVSSIVGQIGICPLHRLGFIWIGGQAVFALNDVWNASGFADTPVATWQGGIPGYNSFVRVYQGLETQTADADLIAATGQQHPSYKGTAYAILFNVNWGAGGGSIQNVEIEWISVPPALNGWTSADDNLYGVNLIAATAGLLSHRRGGSGLGPYIDPVVWGAQAQALETNGVGGRIGEETYSHPVYTQAKDTQTMLTDLAPYADLFFPITGQTLGVSWRPGTTPSSSGLTVLSAQDHTEPPELDATGRDALPSVVVVTYTEDKTYATRAAISQVSRNIAAAPGNRTTKKIDMPFLKGPQDGVTNSVPQIVATRLGQDAGVLDASGTSKVFRRSAVWASGVPLAPGDLFVLNYAQYNLNRIVRVKAINDDSVNEYVEIAWMRERGAFPAVYSAPIDVRVVPTNVAPAGIVSTDIQPFLLPTGFGLTRQVVVLVQRPSFAYASCIIWYASVTAGPYASLGTQNYFAVHATMTASASSGSTNIAITTTGVDMPAIQSEAALPQGDDTLLAIVPSTGEVLSVGTITVTTSNHFVLSVLRGRQDSTANSIANSADIWLVSRASLVGWTNAEWMNIFSGGVYNSTTATKFFEVQPASATKTGTAGPSGGVSYTLGTTVPTAPTGLIAIAPGGPVVSLAWTPSTAPYFETYSVQRATSGSGGPWTTIGFTSVAKFDDTGTVGGVTVGTTYWYQILAVDVYGNFSSASSVVSCVPTGTAADTTPPNAAGDVTKNADGTVVTAGDGTVSAGLIFNVPGLTTAGGGFRAAATQNLLWRIHGTSSNWQIGAAELTNSSTTQVELDLIPAGTAIDVALQEFTNYKIGGSITVSSSGPFTTPNKSSGPSGPTSLTLSSPSSTNAVPAAFQAISNSQMYGAYLAWTADSAKDIFNYDVGASNSTGTTPSAAYCVTSNLFQPVYIPVILSTFWWVRSRNTSGQISPWILCSTDMTSVMSLSAGSMSTQQRNSPNISGLQVGGSGFSGSASTTNTDGWSTGVYSTTGGSPDESFNVTLPGGFSAKPTVILITPNSAQTPRKVYFTYASDSLSNSSTNAVFEIHSVDGTSFGASELYRYGWKAFS